MARNYLVNQRPDAVLNIVDGTNLERNLYLTTQLLELGIPVVVAVNMMDILRRSGGILQTQALSAELGCPVVEISALKGEGIAEAARAALEAAEGGRAVPLHPFTGPVEHAIAHIEEAAVHGLPPEQQRWYAVKIFERDEKVLGALGLDRETLAHIEKDIQAAERELDDDAESIITNERYVYIASLMKRCSRKKNAGGLSVSDRIDRVVTNRILALPIFVAVMWAVYSISIGSIGDWTVSFMNDTLFGEIIPPAVEGWLVAVAVPTGLTSLLGGRGDRAA